MTSSRILLFSLILTVIVSCETTEEYNKMVTTTGLSPEAQNPMLKGDFVAALDSQLSGPRGDCSPGQYVPERPKTSLENVSERPKRGNADEENNKICEKRAWLARDRGVDTLTVSFEGLGAYNGFFTNSFYDYYDDPWTGKNSKPPSGLGPHMGRNLISPHLKDDYKKSDFLLFGERGGAGVMEECVAIF